VISAYGPRALRYAALLGDINAVICDPDYLGEGYLEAIRRREAGDSFYGLVLIDEPRVTFGYRHGEEMLSQVPDYDARRLLLDQLVSGTLPINGKRADETWVHERMFAQVVLEFLALSDAMLVRSYAEHGRLAGMFMHNVLARPVRPVERILAAASIPTVKRVRPVRPGVVVWAPLWTAAETALVMHGLTEFHGNLTCVSHGGPRPTYANATFLETGDPAVADALATAAAVVCVAPSDPADAVGFARAGYGVVAPISSGAHEFAGDIVPWDALDARSLFTAVAVALARPASVHTEPSRPPFAPRKPARPEFITELPLVSIITPTYNRREDLRTMLTCLAAQTYPNLESIVVNDGGVAVDDIVAEFPFARLIDQKENVGAVKVTEAGRAHVRGEYIALLADDDWLYPDHVERLMNAIFQSGCDVAHGAAVLRFLEREPNGAWRTIGFNATTFCQTLAPSDALVTASLGTFQMIVRNSVYDEFGWYIADLEIADNEIHARFTKKHYYAFADHITAECRDHSTVLSRALNFPAALRRMYTQLHPVTGRPLLDRIREATISNVEARPVGQPPFPMSIRLTKKIG